MKYFNLQRVRVDELCYENTLISLEKSSGLEEASIMVNQNGTQALLKSVNIL